MNTVSHALLSYTARTHSNDGKSLGSDRQRNQAYQSVEARPLDQAVGRCQSIPSNYNWSSLSHVYSRVSGSPVKTSYELRMYTTNCIVMDDKRTEGIKPQPVSRRRNICPCHEHPPLHPDPLPYILLGTVGFFPSNSSLFLLQHLKHLSSSPPRISLYFTFSCSHTGTGVPVSFTPL